MPIEPNELIANSERVQRIKENIRALEKFHNLSHEEKELITVLSTTTRIILGDRPAKTRLRLLKFLVHCQELMLAEMPEEK